MGDRRRAERVWGSERVRGRMKQAVWVEDGWVRAGQEIPGARDEDAAAGASAFRVAEGMVNHVTTGWNVGEETVEK